VSLSKLGEEGWGVALLKWGKGEGVCAAVARGTSPSHVWSEGDGGVVVLPLGRGRRQKRPPSTPVCSKGRGWRLKKLHALRLG